MAVDAVGGESNAFTSKEYTGYYVKVAAQHLELATDLLEDVLWHSLYAQEEVERERNVILEEINMYRDSPRDVAAEDYDKLLYASQPLGMEVIGTPQSLAKINSDSIKKFNQQWYTPNNMVVAIAGPVDPEQVKADIAKLFTSRQSDKVSALVPAQFDQSTPQLVVHTKPVDQTQLLVGWRSFAITHPDRYVLTLIATILGGNMSSRLFTEVRERRGLAYAVHASLDDFIDTGSIMAVAGLGPNTVAEAFKVILEQFENVRQGGVSAEELERAKQYTAGRLALSTEDALGTVIYHGRQWLLENRIRTLDIIMEGIRAVTLEDVERVSQELFVPRGLNVVALGPKVDEQALRAQLPK